MRHLLLSALVAILAGCATGREAFSPPSPAQTAPLSTPQQTAAVAEDQRPGPPPLPPSGTAPNKPSEMATTKEIPAAERRLSAAELAALNDERLLDVYRGMPRRAVEQLMDVRQGERLLNPFRREWLRDDDGRLYEVLYYLTREPFKGRAVGWRDLTPVIFLDDKVHAIGRYSLKKLKRSACVIVTATSPCLSRR